VSGGGSRDLLGRIARGVLANASVGRERIAIGPFVALVDRVSPSPWASLAVPDPAARDAEWAGPLPALAAHFAARGRDLRFEFLEDLFPGLAAALEAGGWGLQSRDPLLACAPADLVPPPPVPGLALEPVHAGSDDGLLELFLAVQHEAFEPGRAREPSAALREQLRARLAAGAIRCLLARLDGVPAGAGCSLPAGDVAEIAGIGTLPALRGRGVASAITARLVGGLFATGTETAWLTAGSGAAARVYERIGFRPLGAFQRNYGR
jgi:ribosomal protein S18 acetylase RimI-like enzyme